MASGNPNDAIIIEAEPGSKHNLSDPDFTAGPFVTRRNPTGEISSLMKSLYIEGNSDTEAEIDDAHIDDDVDDVDDDDDEGGGQVVTEGDRDRAEKVTHATQTQEKEIKNNVKVIKEQVMKLETDF